MSEIMDDSQPAPKQGTVGIVGSIIKDYELADVVPNTPWGVVRDLLIERREFGIKKYGRPLEAWNGRDSVLDLEGELVDGFKYSEQGVIESQRIPRVRAQAMLNMLEHIGINIRNMMEDSSDE